MRTIRVISKPVSGRDGGEYCERVGWRRVRDEAGRPSREREGHADTVVAASMRSIEGWIAKEMEMESESGRMEERRARGEG